MPPKELSRHQLSSKLSYQTHVPAFLQKLQNRMAGISDAPSDEDEPQYEDEEYEYVGGGRPPIPRRPPIPQRPASQPGSCDEAGGEDKDEEGDEKPQIVVLKEGKHLNQREVENIKRKEKGLPPLPESHDHLRDSVTDPQQHEKPKGDSKNSSTKSATLSFSSGKPLIKASNKRKAFSQPDSDSENDLATKMGTKKLGSISEGKEKSKGKEKNKEKVKKKPKKESKKLLSFGDDA